MCGYYDDLQVADVRPGDGGKPEIIISCQQNGGSPNTGPIYVLYGKTTWPAAVDLHDLD